MIEEDNGITLFSTTAPTTTRTDTHKHWAKDEKSEDSDGRRQQGMIRGEDTVEGGRERKEEE